MLVNFRAFIASTIIGFTLVGCSTSTKQESLTSSIINSSTKSLGSSITGDDSSQSEGMLDQFGNILDDVKNKSNDTLKSISESIFGHNDILIDTPPSLDDLDKSAKKDTTGKSV